MFIAESKLYGERRGTPRKRVLFGIEPLVKDVGGDVSCTVHIRGIDRPRKIFGVDSLQALALSFAFLQQRLGVLQSSGWRFYFKRGDSTPFDLSLVWFGKNSSPSEQRPNKPFNPIAREDARSGLTAAIGG